MTPSLIIHSAAPTVGFFGRLDNPLLRAALMGLSIRKAAMPSGWDAQRQSKSPRGVFTPAPSSCGRRQSARS